MKSMPYKSRVSVPAAIGGKSCDHNACLRYAIYMSRFEIDIPTTTNGRVGVNCFVCELLLSTTMFSRLLSVIGPHDAVSLQHNTYII